MMIIRKNKFVTYLFIFVAVVMVSQLTACTAEPGRLRLLNENSTILAFGDSLTAGIGTQSPNDYPSVLSKLSGVQVINAGVSGEKTDGGLQRLPGLLSNYQPDLLIIFEGGNDILRNVDKKTIKRNLNSMIELAQSQDIDVVLIGVPERKLFSDSAELYSELAEQHNLVLEKALLADLLLTIEYKSDAVHLNAAGYQKLAEGIFALLKENGAL